MTKRFQSTFRAAGLIVDSARKLGPASDSLRAECR
jgi:hypothetical protein